MIHTRGSGPRIRAGECTKEGDETTLGSRSRRGGGKHRGYRGTGSRKAGGDLRPEGGDFRREGRVVLAEARRSRFRRRELGRHLCELRGKGLDIVVKLKGGCLAARALLLRHEVGCVFDIEELSGLLRGLPSSGGFRGHRVLGEQHVAGADQALRAPRDERMPAVKQTKKNIVTVVGLELVDVLGRQVTPLIRRITRCQDEPCVVGGDPVPPGVFIIVETDLLLFTARETSTGLEKTRLTHVVLAREVVLTRARHVLALILFRVSSTSGGRAVAGASGAPTIIALIAILLTGDMR